MKMTEDSTKAEMHLNMRREKIMASEEMQNFNIDNKDIKIAKDFDYLVLGINSNEGCS